MPVAHIAFPVPIYHTFDYSIPENLKISVGCRVRVPFGNNQRIGIIVEINNKSQLPFNKLRNIGKILDNEPFFSPSVWQLLLWGSNYYHYPIGHVLFHAMPFLLRQGKSVDYKSVIWCWYATKRGLKIDINNLRRSPKQQQVLSILRRKKIWKHQLTELGFAESVLKNLKKKGLSEIIRTKPALYNWKNNFSINQDCSELNSEQKIAVNLICSSINKFSVWVLEDTLSSTKTEVYLNILKNVLSQGKQGLVMIPEISLIPRTIACFQQCFNVPIKIFHSGIKHKEHLNVWLKAKTGEIAIVIGTRSSLFIPFKNLGIIVIDEEHDTSYKQKEGWRYHARDLAIYRAHSEHIPIILGSATPTLETLHNVYQKKYRIFRLKRLRQTGSIRPTIQCVLDLKRQKIKDGMSTSLIVRMHQHLKANNQVILFLNRRGFAPMLLCHDCGWTSICHRCNRYHTFYQEKQQLCCHYCYSCFHLPYQCPSCSSTHLIPIGIGTERLEKSLNMLFPFIPISRIDRDTINLKGALEQRLEVVYRGGAHILIGTQMLAKRHYFPDVTLMAFLNVDSAFFSSDFRSAERFAQLYIQIIRYIGQEEKPREIVLQTHYPKHLLLQTLLQKGYSAFAEKVLHERRIMRLMPWINHALIRAEDDSNQHIVCFFQRLRSLLLQIISSVDKELLITGPIPSFTSNRSSRRYHWYFLLQHPSRIQLQNIINNVLEVVHNLPEARKVRWTLDIDPIEN